MPKSTSKYRVEEHEGTCSTVECDNVSHRTVTDGEKSHDFCDVHIMEGLFQLAQQEMLEQFNKGGSNGIPNGS